MTTVTVAVVGDREVAAALGKKGTQSDVAMFNQVRDGHQATIVAPVNFPERFPPLLTSVAMADRTVFVVPALTKEFAEIAATLDVVAPPMEIRVGDGVGPEEVRRALKGSSLETTDIRPLQLPELREAVDAWVAPDRPGPVRVRLDHAFPVKGVGAVALGLVRQGSVHAHDALRLYPLDRTVEVRSIQVHDADVREASSGSRVGLALKGIEAEELARGQVLAEPGALKVGPAAELADWRTSRYYRGKLSAGQSLHAGVGLQFVPAKVEALEGNTLRASFDRPVAYEPGDPAFLADLSVTAGPRIVGRGTLR